MVSNVFVTIVTCFAGLTGGQEDLERQEPADDVIHQLHPDDEAVKPAQADLVSKHEFRSNKQTTNLTAGRGEYGVPGAAGGSTSEHVSESGGWGQEQEK